jgi:hypothetical protein
MGNKKQNKANVSITYEIEVNSDHEETLNELLAYLQYTKKVYQYRMIAKKTQDQGQTSAVPPADSNPPVKVDIKIDVKAQEKLETIAEEDIFKLIKKWRSDRALIRLTAVKNKGVSLNIACKILNFDEDSGNLTVYDVDSKKVESVHMIEIEDLHAAQN